MLNKNAYNNMYAFFVDRFQQIKANITKANIGDYYGNFG